MFGANKKSPPPSPYKPSPGAGDDMINDTQTQKSTPPSEDGYKNTYVVVNNDTTKKQELFFFNAQGKRQRITFGGVQAFNAFVSIKNKMNGQQQIPVTPEIQEIITKYSNEKHRPNAKTAWQKFEVIIFIFNSIANGLLSLGKEAFDLKPALALLGGFGNSFTATYFNSAGQEAPPVRTFRQHLGFYFSISFAICCGVIAAAAATSVVGGSVLAPLVYLLLFVSGTYANFKMSYIDLPKILSQGISGLFKDKDGRFLSLPRLLLLAPLLVMSTLFGFYVSALSWGLTLSLLGTAIGIQLFAGFIGVVTFVCLAAILVNASSGMVKTPDIISSIQEKLAFLTKRMPADEGKSSQRFFVERLLAGIVFTVLTAATLGIMLWGQFTFILNCTARVNDLLKPLFDTFPNALNTLSWFGNTLSFDKLTSIGGFLAYAGQTPFVAKTALVPLLNAASREESSISICEVAELPPEKTIEQQPHTPRSSTSIATSLFNINEGQPTTSTLSSSQTIPTSAYVVGNEGQPTNNLPSSQTTSLHLFDKEKEVVVIPVHPQQYKFCSIL